MTGQPQSCVLLADRHLGLAEGVRGLLESSFGTVVMVSDESSLFEVAGRLQPDVVVVDLSLTHRSDLMWLRGIGARAPGSKLIALSVHDERSVRQAVLDAGADEFVLKREISTELLKAVSRVRGDQEAESTVE
jgi:DNA-binding NarL/FixJ family response regulator